jgi:hypothetical protein
VPLLCPDSTVNSNPSHLQSHCTTSVHSSTSNSIRAHLGLPKHRQLPLPVRPQFKLLPYPQPRRSL